VRQNYQHGKRQREMAKKQKKEEKLQRRMERKNNPEDDLNGITPVQEQPLPDDGEDSAEDAEEGADENRESEP
jgi:hypothetical protein